MLNLIIIQSELFGLVLHLIATRLILENFFDELLLIYCISVSTHPICLNRVKDKLTFPHCISRNAIYHLHNLWDFIPRQSFL